MPTSPIRKIVIIKIIISSKDIFIRNLKKLLHQAEALRGIKAERFKLLF